MPLPDLDSSSNTVPASLWSLLPCIALVHHGWQVILVGHKPWHLEHQGAISLELIAARCQ